MTSKKDEALRMAIEAMEIEGIGGCEAAEACKAALSDAVTLPDGWVAVPVNPTYKMIQAGLSYFNKAPDNTYGFVLFENVYKAMLQAAPTLNEKG